MARPPLILETWGKIRRRTVHGRHIAYARYRDVDGITRIMERVGATPAAAERNLVDALKRRLAPAGEDITREATVAQLAEQWLEGKRREDKATGTIKRYADITDRIIVPGLREVRVGEMTVPRADRFIGRCVAKWGESTSRTVRTVLLQMFTYAVRQGAIERNPIESARTVVVKRKAEIALDVHDIRRIRSLLLARDEGTDKQGRRRYTRVSDVADFYIGTGARTNEVLALGFTDIHFEASPPFARLDKTLIVDEAGKLVPQDKPKTDDSIRDVVLPPSLVTMLLRRRVDAHGELVFPSSTGTPQWDNNLMRQWSAALEGTPYASVTPVKFRKAVATLLAERIGPEAAAAQLGHSDADITKKHYIKNVTQGPAAARDELEAFYAPVVDS